MEIKVARKKKSVLEKNIIKLLQEYCEETGLKFINIKIECDYGIEVFKGTYNINMSIENPFK